MVEVWFHYQSFCEAQESGYIDQMDIFDYSAVLGMAIRVNGSLKAIDDLPISKQIALLKDRPEEIIHTRPFDPFISSRAYIIRCHEIKQCLEPIPIELSGKDPQGYWMTVSALTLPSSRALVGLARIRTFHCPPISAYELSLELSVVRVAEQLRLFRLGYDASVPISDIDKWKKWFKLWEEYPC